MELIRPTDDLPNDLRCPCCDQPAYEAGRDDLEETRKRLPSPRFIFIYDVYVRVTAHSKEEADQRLSEVERAVAATRHCTILLFDAYGVEDAETGEELRQVH